MLLRDGSMVFCCSEDVPQDGSLVRLSSSVIILLLSDVLEHFVHVQSAAGILRMVAMKSLSVYQRLHMRKRSKQQDCLEGPSPPVLTMPSYILLQGEQLSECH